MPSTIGQMIATSGAASLRYGEALLKDIRADQFARLPNLGGKVIQTNHPAWVYGHLSLYPRRVLGMVGLDADAPANPAGFEDLFKNGTSCLDDPAGTIYPKMEAITAHFLAAMRYAIQTLPKADDAVFSKQNPIEGRMRELFPTIGVAATFMLGGAHAMSHLGQVSAWRRCMGMTSAT